MCELQLVMLLLLPVHERQPLFVAHAARVAQRAGTLGAAPPLRGLVRAAVAADSALAALAHTWQAGRQARVKMLIVIKARDQRLSKGRCPQSSSRL